MNKEQFKKWIMSMLYYRYKIKATENGEFLGMINDNLNQLINSVKEDTITVCAKKWLGIDISKDGIKAIRDKK